MTLSWSYLRICIYLGKKIACEFLAYPIVIISIVPIAVSVTLHSLFCRLFVMYNIEHKLFLSTPCKWWCSHL